jgi:hypothetical protein
MDGFGFIWDVVGALISQLCPSFWDSIRPLKLTAKSGIDSLGRHGRVVQVMTRLGLLRPLYGTVQPHWCCSKRCYHATCTYLGVVPPQDCTLGSQQGRRHAFLCPLAR